MPDESSLDCAMEKKTFGMSEKNIPISMKQEHNMLTIHRSEKLVKRMRWEAKFELNPQEKGVRKETFGLQSQKPAPSIPELKEFERGLYGLVAGIKYKEGPNIRSSFQRSLDNEIRDIKKEKRVFVGADKSSNYYKMSSESYNGLLEKAVHKDFKKAKEGEEERVTKDAKAVATRLEIDERVFRTELKPSKVTIKDHKEDFLNKTQTRLINPTKPNLGRVSKWKMERLIRQVKAKSKLRQWKNTDSTLAWYRLLDNKAALSFVVCDIVDYYPSITADLLDQALDWAAGWCQISQDDRELFKHTKDSLLWHEGCTWVKRGEVNFDVAQGSFDGAETTDLVGLFILSKLQHLQMNEGLYRDDLLAVTELQGKEAEKLKQDISKVFKAFGLTVKVEVNKKRVNYLNVTLDLTDGSYRDYMKPGQVIKYVHVDSNHPPCVTKSIGEGVNHRLNANSSNERMFEAAKGPYQEALERSGHVHKLVYKPEEAGGAAPRRRRRRKRNDIIWFNPPWCNSVTSDVGRKFLNLLDACFPPSNPLSRIFNRKKVKVSYSTMPSLGRIIAGHNAKVIASKVVKVPKRPWGDCSCPRKTREAGECPLGGDCLADCIVYRASVEVKPRGVMEVEDAPVETYLGLVEPEWKGRLGNHKQDFKTSSRRDATCLSTYIWSLKEKGLKEDRDFSITWALVGRAKAYSPTSDSCRLCLKEKSLMILKPEWAKLNSRDEFFNHCRHKNKLLLANT